MTTNRLEINAFLERIAYQGPIEPTLETLKGLQRAFLLTVPFENLDIHFDDKTPLSFTEFYEKIVNQRRGGISYECNGLLYSMLQAMGFDVQMLSARIVLDSAMTPEFDHMVLLISLPGNNQQMHYLVDVGSGQSCPEPLALNQTDEYLSENCSYRLGSYQNLPALFYKTRDSDWQVRFVFSLEPHTLADFGPMFRFHQNSEQSVFTQGQLVTMMTPTGRITLNGMTLIIVDENGREVRELVSQDEYFACLENYFGIEFENP